MAIVQRETFQGFGTLNNASPGNLGVVLQPSSFSKRPVGPKVSGDMTAQGLGWSADLHLTSANPGGFGRHDVAVSGAGQAAGMFTCFYYIDSYNSNGTRVDITGAYLNNGNQLLKLQISPVTGTFWYSRKGLWTDTDSAITVPLRPWFELRIQWVTSGSTCASLSADLRLAGSATWTSLYTTTTAFSMGTDLSVIRSGAVNLSGSSSGFRGRYGMPGVYSMANWSDRLDPLADVVDPVAGHYRWYVDPVAGNDSNDGLSPTSAWASVAKINEESQYCGMFPTDAGYANGDSLTIDTRVANLPLGPSTLSINTRGLHVIQLGGGLGGAGEIQAWHSIPNSSFIRTTGTTKVFQSADTDTSAVLWENDKWMAHPTGPNLAAALTALESTPGSFWTDGTTMYVHPFGDTDPGVDGKQYTRSYYRSNSYAAVQVVVADVRLSGLRVRKTCIADKSNNDPGINYCFQGQGGFGGTNLIDNCYGAYGSKHIFGFTDNDTARQTTVIDCQAEQGSPYSSQTPWVDYSSLTASGTATTTYINCTTNASVGLIGSSAGNPDPSGGWICHNNGSANYQFAQISFNDCHINGTLDTYGAVHSLRVNRGSSGGGQPRSPDAMFSQVLIRGLAPSCDQAGGMTRVRNCIISPVSISAGNGAAAAQGTIDYQGNTIDLRCTAGNASVAAMFRRSGLLSLIWKNNYVIGSASFEFVVLENGLNTDSYAFCNNAYTLGPQLKAVKNYNDGSTSSDRTFNEWQALGKDAGSIVTTPAAAITSDYKPLSGGPLVDSGTNIGPLSDFSGSATFNPRNDIGAYEFLTPIETWRVQYFGSPYNEGAGADNVISAHDGLPNLMKYAFGFDPLIPAVSPIASGIDSGYLRMVVAKNPQASDLEYWIEVSANMTSGTDWSTSGTTIEVDSPTILQVRDNTRVSDASARFLRLAVARK